MRVSDELRCYLNRQNLHLIVTQTNMQNLTTLYLGQGGHSNIHHDHMLMADTQTFKHTDRHAVYAIRNGYISNCISNCISVS